MTKGCDTAAAPASLDEGCFTPFADYQKELCHIPPYSSSHQNLRPSLSGHDLHSVDHQEDLTHTLWRSLSGNDLQSALYQTELAHTLQRISRALSPRDAASLSPSELPVYDGMVSLSNLLPPSSFPRLSLLFPFCRLWFCCISIVMVSLIIIYHSLCNPLPSCPSRTPNPLFHSFHLAKPSSDPHPLPLHLPSQNIGQFKKWKLLTLSCGEMSRDEMRGQGRVGGDVGLRVRIKIEGRDASREQRGVGCAR
jgi:hypothetical protein